MVAVMFINMMLNLLIVMVIAVRSIILLTIRYAKRTYFYGNIFLNNMAEAAMKIQLRGEDKYELFERKCRSIYNKIYKVVEKLLRPYPKK